MTAAKFSIDEALDFGWKTTMANLGFWIGVLLIGALVPLGAIGLITGGAGIAGLDTSRGSISNSIASFAHMMLSVIVTTGMLRICLKFSDQQKPSFGDMFSIKPVLAYYFFGSILYSLITGVGLFLLIVPGIIWALQFYFFGLFVVDKEIGPIAALKQSSGITAGVKWNLLGFSLLTIIINLLGALCLLIGLFVTIPMTLLAQTYVYRQLLATNSGSEQTIRSNPDVHQTATVELPSEERPPTS